MLLNIRDHASRRCGFVRAMAAWQQQSVGHKSHHQCHSFLRIHLGMTSPRTISAAIDILETAIFNYGNLPPEVFLLESLQTTTDKGNFQIQFLTAQAAPSQDGWCLQMMGTACSLCHKYHIHTGGRWIVSLFSLLFINCSNAVEVSPTLKLLL